MCAALSGAVDSAYQQGADFLRGRVGLENPAIIARTLDVAMNPNSLFVSFRDKKRSKNANVSRPVHCRLQELCLHIAHRFLCTSCGMFGSMQPMLFCFRHVDCR